MMTSLRAHPDKGGDNEGYQKLTAAHDSWQSLLKNKRDVGRPKESSEQQRPKAAKPCQLVCARQQNGFWVRSQVVLLIHQSFSVMPPLGLVFGHAFYAASSPKRKLRKSSSGQGRLLRARWMLALRSHDSRERPARDRKTDSQTDMQSSMQKGGHVYMTY